MAPGPRPPIRWSELMSFQVSPASFETYTPPFLFASTDAYIRVGSLGATAMPIRPRPSSAAGNPLVSGRQFVPPSVDLKIPLPAVIKEAPLRTSHGATRAAHKTA